MMIGFIVLGFTFKSLIHLELIFVYGVTIGNSLRRVLLSSISGAAITAVRVDGVVHEFTTVSGVKEDEYVC